VKDLSTEKVKKEPKKVTPKTPNNSNNNDKPKFTKEDYLSAPTPEAPKEKKSKEIAKKLKKPIDSAIYSKGK
jgi:hypothetical protein